MRTSTLIASLLAAGALSIQTGLAADAAHPYSGVNHAVDAGNDTGDSQVDRLNQEQLQRVSGSDPTQRGNNGHDYDGRGYRGGYYGRPGYAYGYRPGWGYGPAYGYPYPAYAYAYPAPYYAAPYFRPVFGWGWRGGWGWGGRWGWGWHHRW